MPARDAYHDQCKAALIKDGWKITDDPLSLKWAKKDVHIDLGAEEIVAAEKLGRKIAVEIKSFVGPSELHDLQQALGQFIIYRAAIGESSEPGRDLFLAIPERIYFRLFSTPEGMSLIETENLQVIVFDPQTEEIKRWIP